MDWSKDRRKAFLWTAEAFGTPPNERTEEQKSSTLLGICDAISILTDSNEIRDWARDFNGRGYWWKIAYFNGDKACDDERSLFCCLMAALTDKEFEEISG